MICSALRIVFGGEFPEDLSKRLDFHPVIVIQFDWRMEVGLFFMPKFGWLRNQSVTIKLSKKKARWKLCAQESHWNVQNARTAITT